MSAGARALRWEGSVGDSPAGVRFDSDIVPSTDADESITLRIRVDGHEPPACALRLGKDGEHPAAAHFTYTSTPATLFADAKETPALSTDVTPDLTAGACGPVTVFVWRFPTTGPAGSASKPADEETRRRLALGYVP